MTQHQAKAKSEAKQKAREKIHTVVDEMLDDNAGLDLAILIALVAHKGQRDKGGATYLRHPLRVMAKCDTEDEMMAAVMHDAVEDSEWLTLNDLLALGIPQNTVNIVALLTKNEGEGLTYDQYMQRILPHPTARKIKKADIEDNLDLRRIKNAHDLQEKDHARIAKYLKWFNLL